MKTWLLHLSLCWILLANPILAQDVPTDPLQQKEAAIRTQLAQLETAVVTMVEKMEGFVGSIAKVNGITHHSTTIGDNISASEFTFDFDMKDGSKILWHEIIKRF